MNQNNKIKIGFFGTPEYSVIVLRILKNVGFDISFIVTMPDKPKGRKLIMTPPPAKVWAIENNIPVYQPDRLNDENLIETLKKHNCDVFIVIAYGKIIPDSILNIPKYKSLNIHGSLLPKLRGSSPIESAILTDEKDTGVTIIRMDNEMDHGPIVAMQSVNIDNWPPKAQVLGNEIVTTGANLLVNILPKWIKGEIKEIEQDHSKASFTKKIIKEDGLINLDNDSYKNYLKIQAYHMWPSAYFIKDGKRIKITKASFIDGKLTIEKIIPEGKKETTFKKD